MGRGPLSRDEPIPGCPALLKEKRTLPGALVNFSGFVFVTALGALRRSSPPLRVLGSEPDSLSIGRRQWRPSPSLPNGVRPSLRTDWPMFNCCSHGTLLIFGLQSSCLNIATTTKICTRGGSTHALGFHATHSCSTCPAVWARLAGGAPPSGDGGSHLSRQALAFTFIAPWGLVDTLWLVRALDSLVRVSRRVGWVADLTADLEHPLRRPDPRPDGAARSETDWGQSAPVNARAGRRKVRSKCRWPMCPANPSNGWTSVKP